MNDAFRSAFQNRMLALPRFSVLVAADRSEVLVIHLVDPAIEVGWLAKSQEFAPDTEFLVLADLQPEWCPVADLFDAPAGSSVGGLPLQPCEVSVEDGDLVIACGRYVVAFDTGVDAVDESWPSLVAAVEAAYGGEAFARRLVNGRALAEGGPEFPPPGPVRLSRLCGACGWPASLPPSPKDDHHPGRPPHPFA